ncbi:MAG: cytidine deaminase [Bacteroidia bacterium]|nr:cytidine deaminase [Bacteroidia bacterium]NNC86024.1 cytidine deaminase [Bacteroidia bacterium]
MSNIQPDSNFTLLKSVKDLTETEQLLITKAKEAAMNAYAPYSEFYVGAALELRSGEILVGNNQENAAYPSGLCAERVLLFSTGANYPSKQIKTLAVLAYKNDKIVAATPCGACRQVMVEYEQKQENPIKIIMYKGEDDIIVSNDAKGLLPFAFDSKSLLNK